MAIKAIIFDCFGVLIMAGHTVLYQDYPDLKLKISDLQLKSDSGKITRQQFDSVIAESTGLSSESVEQKYWSINKFNQPMVDLVSELKQSGRYKIVMLSNINRDWMDTSLPVFEKAKLFDAVILSGDVDMVKPDPAIFKLAAIRLGVLPSECVMIDDVAKNIDGAKLAGMQGIVYVSTDQTRTDLWHLLESINA